jgi:hypothetical protein
MVSEVNPVPAVPVVVVVWMDEGLEVATLVYKRSGTRPIRCYPRDAYDGRLEGGLPYFETLKEGISWMLSNRGKHCQLNLEAARLLFHGEFEADLPS